MQRKLIRQGAGGLTLCLPKKWTEENKLEPGSEVEVVCQETNIIVKADLAKPAAKKIHLKFEKNLLGGIKPYRLIQRLLSIVYKQGYDEVKISSTQQEILRYVEQRATLFIGFEVVEQGKDFLILKDVVGAGEDLNVILNRCFLLLNTIAKESFLSIQNFSETELMRIKNLERTNGKLTDYCKRILVRLHLPKEKYIYSLIAENERLADEYKYMIDTVLENKLRLGNETLKLYQETNDLVVLFSELLRKYDFEKVKLISQARDNLTKKIKQQIYKARGAETLVLHNLSNIVIKVYEITETYLEMEFTNILD